MVVSCLLSSEQQKRWLHYTVKSRKVTKYALLPSALVMHILKSYLGNLLFKEGIKMSVV